MHDDSDTKNINLAGLGIRVKIRVVDNFGSNETRSTTSGEEVLGNVEISG